MSVTAADSAVSLLDEPYDLQSRDDGRVSVHVPGAVDDVVLRYVEDGEARAAKAQRDADGVWSAQLPLTNPVTPYRWLLTGGEYGYAWLNGVGLANHDVPDADDFVVSLDRAPGWHAESVVYEIFPDRFASSGLAVQAPEWAVPREWDALPTGRGPETPFEWFGGDLLGIEQQLDYIESLGANVIYLTPIFPAGSTHRYDSTTFEHVDPLLGGDDALVSLVRAAHARGIRVTSDLTTNHTGDKHEWFVAGERELYLFDESGDYESWWGVKSLPKLNWRSPELRRRLQHVTRKWLQPPFDLDGWRVDVANMSGRTGETDLNRDVAPTLRKVLDDDSLLVAEHFHDFRPDFRGWHGAMNYSGFSKPVWYWLRRDGTPALGLPVEMPRFTGAQAVATMRAFAAGVPWSFVLNSWALLDSHDSPRFRTIAASRDLQLVGVGLQMTLPGVPMVFAGDEIGLEGEWGEDARRTMPWTKRDTWDAALLDTYKQLIALRRSRPALARGGIRYAYVDDDVIAYVRESRDERLLCLASRAPHEPVRLPLQAEETLYGDDADDGRFPADGPAFHVWRLSNG